MQMTTKNAIKEASKIKTLKFCVLIVVDKDSPGFHAYAPSLKGLHMGGDTEKEARENAKQAAALYLKSLLKHGDPLPIDVLHNGAADANITTKHVSSQVEEIQVKL
jgi:predicted RNase H-like HicB family nuclease